MHFLKKLSHNLIKIAKNIKFYMKILFSNILVIFRASHSYSYLFVMQITLKKKLLPIVNSANLDRKKMNIVHNKIIKLHNKA